MDLEKSYIKYRKEGLYKKFICLEFEKIQKNQLYLITTDYLKITQKMFDNLYFDFCH